MPPACLPTDLDLDRPTRRLDLEWERRGLVIERDNERLPTPLRRGDRVLEYLVPSRERDLDFHLLLGDRDKEGDLRPPRLGDRDTFLLGERELLRRFGETDEFLCRLGDLDFIGDLNTFFLGVTEGEADGDRRINFFGDLREGIGDFFVDLGDTERDLERDSCRLFRGDGDRLPFELDLD